METDASIGGVEDEEDQEDLVGDEPVEMPIEREIDLHTFAPADAASVVEEYVNECARLGFDEVRIVHGKGKGTIRRTVHAVLDRHPMVASYEMAGGNRGSWGATLVRLKRAATP